MKLNILIYLIFSLYLISCHKNESGNKLEVEYSNEVIKQKIKIGDNLKTVVNILGKPSYITTQEDIEKHRLKTGKSFGILGGDFLYNYKYNGTNTGIIFKNDIVIHITD